MTLSLDALRVLCDRNFFFFAKLIGGAAWVPKPGEPATNLLCEEIHRPLCDFISNPKNKRVGIAMPRDWRKTLIYTQLYTIWRYLQDPESCHLIVSEKEDRAAKMMHWIKKQILRNQLLRKIYPELRVVDQSWTRMNRWSGSSCDLPRRGDWSDPSIEAIGVGGAAQGGHYTVIHIDDIIGKRAMESSAVLSSTLLWIDNVAELLAVPDIESAHGGQVVYIGTHYRPGDAIQYLENTRKEFKWKKVSCRKKTKLFNDKPVDPDVWINNPKVNEGDSNFPVFPTQHYIDMLASPELRITYYLQHMNDPSAVSELTKFDDAWLRYYHLEDRGGEQWIVCDDDHEAFPMKDVPLYMKIDPGGFSEEKIKGSRNAIIIGGQPAGSRKKFVTWAWCGRPKEPKKFLDEVFKAFDAQKPRLVDIDSTAAQEYIMRDIKEAQESRGVKFPVFSIEQERGKDVKKDNIMALAQPMQQGEIYIHPTMKEVRAEVAGYSGGGELTNDLLDMMSQLLKRGWKRGERRDVSFWNESSRFVEDTRSVRTGY